MQWQDCAEGTVESLEYYGKLLNVYAVQRPDYQLFTIKPGKMKVVGIIVVCVQLLLIWLFKWVEIMKSICTDPSYSQY